MPTPLNAERKIEILLVEDNPADVRLTALALRGSELHHELRVLHDGGSVMPYLKKEGAYAEVSRPDFVLLDWNLPRKNGGEVLREIKKDPELNQIPVLVLTVSNMKELIQEAYDIGADLFITKPLNFDLFSAIIQYLKDVFEKRKLPPPNEN